ncbi:MAG: hypothetical protein Q8K29_00560, partial [Polaromonas sp.]|nr:hypothetical protein [Polaromonas sp.]
MVWVPFAAAQGQPAVLAKKWGRARTRLRLKQSLALIHFLLRSSAHPDGLREKTNTGYQSRIHSGVQEARSASCTGIATN